VPLATSCSTGTRRGRPHSDLSTVEGAAVRYTAQIDTVVWGEDHQLHLLCHRIRPGDFADRTLLELDEPTLTACWAWSHFMLDDRTSGILFNEIRLDGEPAFRRTSIAVTPAEIALAGRQLGIEALDMIDAGLSLYPNPTEAGCRGCAFTGPCRAMREGVDAEPMLAAEYRVRPDPEPVEGRLGGSTWSINRGARPNRFERGPPEE
jgi:hypothetical protein